MNDPVNDFDTLLADRFGREHNQLPADAFVAGTIHRIRIMQRRDGMLRLGLKVAALLVVVVASPWLIAGSTLLNTALDSAFAWSAGLPDGWAFGAGALVLVAMLAAGALRSRQKRGH